MFFDELRDERVSLSAAYILITVGVFGRKTTARLLQLAHMKARTHTHTRTNTHTHTHTDKAEHRHEYFFLSYLCVSLIHMRQHKSA